ncbi:hypothetical protein EC957_006535 [Mortierella hygrophila]|uniref:DUF202 domain-containing protein n=1 Tax=Mortierella hygrophila TaxID=979708 RepID=A0A9P6FJN3_9FUNG|nr:hypothetical protein EC957_006535 [Mortierella hygrophila]
MASPSPSTFTSSTASLPGRSPSPSRLPPSQQESHRRNELYQESHRRNEHYQESARREPSSPSSLPSSPPSARARLNHPSQRSPSASTFSSSFPAPPHPPPSQNPGHRSPPTSTFSSTSFPPPPPIRHNLDHSPGLPLALSPLHSNSYQQHQQPQKQHSQYQYSTSGDFLHTTSASLTLVPPPVPSSQSIAIPPRRESSYGLTNQHSHSRSTQSPIYSPSSNSFDSRSSPSPLNSGAAYQRYANTDTTTIVSNLTPPQPSYVPSRSRPSVSRPNSIVSVSAYSTHSNEPLNQSKSSKTSTKLQKLYSLNKKSPKNTMSTLAYKDGSSSTTGVSTNHLDLPEHQGMHSNMSHVNLNDPSHLARRSSQSSTRSSSSLTDRKRGWRTRWNEVRPRKYNPQDYNVKGFGRVAKFSNERLYLHWIRFGVLQAGIAVMLLSFGIGIASWVGVGSLILSLLTLIYATQLFHKRHLYMVSKRKDVKFFARTIPTLLTIGLFFLYGSNFVLTMYYDEEARSPPPWTQNDPTNFNSVF